MDQHRDGLGAGLRPTAILARQGDLTFAAVRVRGGDQFARSPGQRPALALGAIAVAREPLASGNRDTLRTLVADEHVVVDGPELLLENGFLLEKRIVRRFVEATHASVTSRALRRPTAHENDASDGREKCGGRAPSQGATAADLRDARLGTRRPCAGEARVRLPARSLGKGLDARDHAAVEVVDAKPRNDLVVLDA